MNAKQHLCEENINDITRICISGKTGAFTAFTLRILDKRENLKLLSIQSRRVCSTGG